MSIWEKPNGPSRMQVSTSVPANSHHSHYEVSWGLQGLLPAGRVGWAEETTPQTAHQLSTFLPQTLKQLMNDFSIASFQIATATLFKLTTAQTFFAQVIYLVMF